MARAEKLKKIKALAKEHWKIVLLSFGLGVVFASFISSYVQIDAFPLGSKRFLAFTFFLGIIGFSGYFFLFRWIRVQLNSLNKKEGISILALSLMMGPLLFFTTTSQWRQDDNYLRIFLPEHRFEISALPGNEPAFLKFSPNTIKID